MILYLDNGYKILFIFAAEKKTHKQTETRRKILIKISVRYQESKSFKVLSVAHIVAFICVQVASDA